VSKHTEATTGTNELLLLLRELDARSLSVVAFKHGSGTQLESRTYIHTSW